MSEEGNKNINHKKVNNKLILSLLAFILLIVLIVIMFIIETNDRKSSNGIIDDKSSSTDEASIKYDDYYYAYTIAGEKLNPNKIKIDAYDNCVLNIDSKLYESINTNFVINVLEKDYNNMESCNDMQDAINNKTILLEKVKYTIENKSQIAEDFYSNTTSTFNLESALSLLKTVNNSIYGANDYYIDNDTKVAIEKYHQISYKEYYLYNDILFGINDSSLKSNICYKKSIFENILKYYYGNQLILSKNLLRFYFGRGDSNHYIIYDELNDCYIHETPEMGGGFSITNNYIMRVNSFKKVNNQYILRANILFYGASDDGGEKLSFTNGCDYDDSTCNIISYGEYYLITEQEYETLFDEDDDINTNSIAYKKIIKDSRLKEYSYIFEEYDGYYYYKGAIES